MDLQLIGRDSGVLTHCVLFQTSTGVCLCLYVVTSVAVLVVSERPQSVKAMKIHRISLRVKFGACNFYDISLSLTLTPAACTLFAGGRQSDEQQQEGAADNKYCSL